jgi:hypothetical protein
MRFADLPKWGVRIPVYVILWTLAYYLLLLAGTYPLPTVLAGR